jgi:hypothetical protein
MNQMKVITNRVPRELIYGIDLNEKERAEFDFLTSEEIDCDLFFRYRGQVYYLGNFMRYDMEVGGIKWDGAQGDSYFSGTLIHICDDHEHVIVGRYYS